MVWNIFILYLVLSICLHEANAKALPQIFLLGTMKSGSSSLYEFMIRHAQICPGITKEVNFIQNDDHFHRVRSATIHEHLRSQYMNHFTDNRCQRKGGIFIDGSPQFHLMEKVMPRFKFIFSLKEMNELKFIVVLREPVARAMSYYNMFTMIALAEGKSFSNIKTAQERDNWFRPNFNDTQSLSLFLQYFRRDQLLVLNSDSLFKNSTAVMKSIAAFLDIPFSNAWSKSFPHDDHMDHPRYRNILKCCEDYVPELDCAFRDKLISRYEPINSMLYKQLAATKAQAFRDEPAFPEFNQAKARALPCVEDARAKYNSKIASSPKTRCIAPEKVKWHS